MSAHYVYRAYDHLDRILYIGCSKNPWLRWKQHLFEHTWWAERAVRFRAEVYPSITEAMRAERRAIETEVPMHNWQFRTANMASWDERHFVEYVTLCSRSPTATTTDVRDRLRSLGPSSRRVSDGRLRSAGFASATDAATLTPAARRRGQHDHHPRHRRPPLGRVRSRHPRPLQGLRAGRPGDGPMSTERPFSELRESGLLWLINATVFHPRGLALAVHIDDEGATTGWSLVYAGDGEPFSFLDSPEIKALFQAAEATLSEAKR